MKQSNKFHKFKAYGHKRTSVGVFEDVGVMFKFDYYNEETRKEIANLFKGYQFEATTVYIITMDKRTSTLATNDQIIIDGNENLIVSMDSKEVQKLGGQRFKSRKKITIMELS